MRLLPFRLLVVDCQNLYQYVLFCRWNNIVIVEVVDHVDYSDNIVECDKDVDYDDDDDVDEVDFEDEDD